MRSKSLASVFLTLVAAVTPALAQTETATQGQKTTSAERKAFLELMKQVSFETIRQDLDAFLSAWTDDLVVLPPGQSSVVGKAAFRAVLERWRDQMRGYTFRRHEMRSEGEGPLSRDYIFAWGTVDIEFNPLPGMEAQPIRKKYKTMHVLKRQADGSWKIHRAMWNEAPVESPAP